MKARMVDIVFSGTKDTGKLKPRIKERGAVSKERLPSICNHASTQPWAGNKAGLIQKQTLRAAGKMALNLINRAKPGIKNDADKWVNPGVGFRLI
jgi:hypothetical protein